MGRIDINLHDSLENKLRMEIARRTGSKRENITEAIIEEDGQGEKKMSQNEDESVIMNILNEYIQIHDKGFGAFKDLINTSKTVDDVKNILTTFVRAYFVESSILFRLAAASVPAIMKS